MRSASASVSPAWWIAISRFRLKSIPITANVTAALNADGSLVGEVIQTAYIISSTVRFDGRLGSSLAPAPGGTSQFRVSGRSGLRLMWRFAEQYHDREHRRQRADVLSQLTTRGSIPASGNTCMYDGNQYFYCDRPRMTMSSCEVR